MFFRLFIRIFEHPVETSNYGITMHVSFNLRSYLSYANSEHINSLVPRSFVLRSPDAYLGSLTLELQQTAES